MTSIYLIRHAQAAGNAGRRFQGRLDHTLTDEGYAQIERLARRFRGVPLERVYTSPLSRAVITAEGVAAPHGLTPIPVDDLIEMDLGVFEDRGYRELEQEYPDAIHNFFDAPHLYEPPNGGETFAEVSRRVKRALDDIAARNPSATVAAVTHGCALRALLYELRGVFPEQMAEVSWFPNTGVCHVAYINGRPRVIGSTDAEHLGGSL